MAKNANQVIQRLCLKPDRFPDHIKVCVVVPRPGAEQPGRPLHRALGARVAVGQPVLRAGGATARTALGRGSDG